MGEENLSELEKLVLRLLEKHEYGVAENDLALEVYRDEEYPKVLEQVLKLQPIARAMNGAELVYYTLVQLHSLQLCISFNYRREQRRWSGTEVHRGWFAIPPDIRKLPEKKFEKWRGSKIYSLEEYYNALHQIQKLGLGTILDTKNIKPRN